MDKREVGGVVNASYEETGGGCYTYWGKLSSGRYFVFALNRIAILNSDFGETQTEKFFEETGGDIGEWEREHLISEGEYPSEETNWLINETFDWLLNKNNTARNNLNRLKECELKRKDKERIIGIVYRYRENDYQISLADFTPAELRILDKILCNHENDSSGERGDADMKIKDANIEYWEKEWKAEKEDPFTAIWNKAYDAYAEGGSTPMWEYLREQMDKGNIAQADANVMAADVKDTYNL